MKNKGFTLIEVIIYIGLFAIMIGGVFVSIFQIIDNSSKNKTQNMLTQEMNFTVKKIEWFLSDMRKIISPTSGQANKLKIQKDSGSAEIHLNSKREIELCLNSNCEKISSADIKIQNLSFVFIDSPGTAPDAIKTIITTPNETFSTINYVKQ